MTDTGPVTVTQADREAAAKLLGGAAPDGLLGGKMDDLSLVQAIARARIEGVRMALEAAADKFREAICRGYETEKCPHGRGFYEDCITCYDEALEAAVERVRQIDPAQIVKGQLNDR